MHVVNLRDSVWVFEWGKYAGFYPVFFISILPVEIKLSKERGWDPNDQVNLPNDCACSKPGLTHLQNIYKLWSYMFNCYLKSGDNYICHSHHESKSTYTNKCGTGMEQGGGSSDCCRKTGIPLTTILDKLSPMRSLLQFVLFLQGAKHSSNMRLQTVTSRDKAELCIRFIQQMSLSER